MNRLLTGIAPLALISPIAASAAEQIHCQTSGGTQTCTITEPTVTQHQTPYPTVRFHPGSVVTVHAGGCVQSGGSGQTWHRYVDPSGPNTDHLYHGLISYPGSGGLVRFAAASQTAEGWRFQIPANVPDNVELILGFEDDDYGNNGYWGHDRDNGPNGQCPTPGTPTADKGKPAWVTITIANTGVPTANKPMDLVSDTVDPNNLPFNPWWIYEKGAGQIPPNPPHPDAGRQCGLRYIDPDNVDLGVSLAGECTTQSPSVNQGSGLNGILCRHEADPGVLAGHLNWFVSTYEGIIHWQDYSGDALHLGDDDYNFTLMPKCGGGLTTARPSWIGLEFDSDEVVDRIDKGWWDDFHKSIKDYAGTDGPAARSIADAPAIAIGMMGLDSEHGAYTELHPLYGLAIHINADVGHQGTDDWVFLARNFGNEGYCSEGILTVPEMKQVSFFIPRDNAIGDDPASPTALDELYSTSDRNFVALSFVPGGAVITFDVGDPGDETLYSGHVQFHWRLRPGRVITGPVNIGPELKETRPVSRSGLPAALGSDQVFVNGVAQKIDVDAEDLKREVFDSLPAASKARLSSILERKETIPHAFSVHRTTVPANASHLGAPTISSSPVHNGVPLHLRATRVPDPEKSAHEAALLTLYCDSYPDGRSPQLTVPLCKSLATAPR